jgi:hypothetical protein
MMRRVITAKRAIACALLLSLAPPGAAAQRVDSTRAGIPRPALPGPRPLAQPAAARLGADSLRPPISPRRAFLYSFLLPGAGQARLDRSTAGGMFFLIELAALVFVHRSAEDLRIARAFSGDSVPARYQADPVTGLVARDTNGNPVPAAWTKAPYDSTWVRTRRLHYEDWMAVLVFNHLFAGADAFVAAQLWDLPEKVSFRATPYGPAVVATIRFR